MTKGRGYMIISHFKTAANRCCRCGGLFEEMNGEKYIYRTEEGEIICDECGTRMNSMARYLVRDNHAMLELSKNNIKWLCNCRYIVEAIGTSFFIVGRACTDEDADDFLKKDTDKCIIEVNNEHAALFLPNCMRVDSDTFEDMKEQYKALERQFLSLFENASAYYIIGSDKQLMGISDIYCRKLRLFRYYMCESGYITYSSEELEKEWKDSDIRKVVRRRLKGFHRREFLDFCRSRIRGQDEALTKAAYLVYKYLENIASCKPFNSQNWLLTAPSGMGKTEFFRVVSEFFKAHDIPVPVVQVDLSRITEEGYKGEDPSTIPKRILEENLESNGYGICFLDEADKKCVPSYGSHGTDFNAAVQSNLLTLVEGIKLKVNVNEDNKNVDFDSNNTMFVFLGAFQSLRSQRKAQTKAVEKNEKSRTIGFASLFDDDDNVQETAEELETAETEAIFCDLNIQDIIDFGMQEELAGRISQVVNFRMLSKESMLDIICCKTKSISEELGIHIELTKAAKDELLDISFTGLGVRRPMNSIRELAQSAVADLFFDDDVDYENDTIVISSLNSAYVKKKSRCGRRKCMSGI